MLTSSLDESVLSYIRALADAPPDVEVRFLQCLASKNELEEGMSIVYEPYYLDLLHDLVGLNMVGFSINGTVLLGMEDFDDGSVIIVKDVFREKVHWGLLSIF